MIDIPVNPRNIDTNGDSMFMKQYGRYTIVGMPSAPTMTAAHELQGTRGDVTVAESSSALERF